MQVILIYIYSLVFCLKIVKCCDCDMEKMAKDTLIRTSRVAVEKRQMNDDDDDSAEVMSDSETTEGITYAAVKVKNLFLKSTDATEKKHRNVNCLFYTDVGKFDIERMSDVWKIAFYKASEKVSCFKMYIKKTTEEERKTWYDIYGDINGTVDWKNCLFEVESSGLKTQKLQQRHFLQGSKEDRGVFKNIIVMRNKDGDTVTQLDQSPDQWLVISQLLLMRDCDNGDVVVFSRLPIVPSMMDIEEALARFGLDASNGTLACETLKDPKYQTLSIHYIQPSNLILDGEPFVSVISLTVARSVCSSQQYPQSLIDPITQYYRQLAYPNGKKKKNISKLEQIK